jgi:hypothetical protein
MDAAPAAACRALRPTRARRPFAQTRGRLSPVGSLSRHNSARSSNERPPAIAPVASNGSAKPYSTTTATSARSEGRTAAASHHPSEQDIYFSPELPMIGPGVHERSYIAREAKLLDLALTLSPATLGAWPMSWMPATYGGAPTEAPGRSLALQPPAARTRPRTRDHRGHHCHTARRPSNGRRLRRVPLARGPDTHLAADRRARVHRRPTGREDAIRAARQVLRVY